jgi:DNA-binding MarR family transcriptional regulator
MNKVIAPEYQLLAEFRYALRRFLRFSESAARQVGLTPQQHQALLAIKGAANGEGLTVGELAERLQVKPHSAVGLADRMESQGLLRRVGGADRRQVYLRLTAKASRLLERLAAAHRDELRRIGPSLRALLESLSPSE